MKTIVNLFCALLLFGSVNAQNYVTDEFIVQYTSGSTPSDHSNLRALYGITDFTTVSEDEKIEVWTSISYPIFYTENGVTDEINDPEELLQHVTIQEGTENGSDTARSNVQDGDLQYILSLVDNDVIYDNGTFDPLPFCDAEHDARLIGPALLPGEQEIDLSVIIVDQQIPDSLASQIEYLDSIDDDLAISPGGQHGRKVYSVVKNQLEQAGVENTEFYNITLFDSLGAGSYGLLLWHIRSLANNQDFNLGQNIVMNFSANMIISDAETDLILWDYWDQFLSERNILLVSAAGNQGIISDNIYPGCAGWQNEITVAGTRKCFRGPWEQSNRNPQHFEIASEAKNVLVFDGENYQLASGTSFSAAQVTGAAVQLAVRCSEFDPVAIKSQLLSTADENPYLAGMVQNGRMLNVTSALETWQNCGLQQMVVNNFDHASQSSIIDSPSLTLQTTPNPFSQNAIVNIGVEV
ncbi:MAG: S8/S53 family peptidase, partial [Bacteroidota bacterium]